jgi:hypothetical protein
VFSMPVDIIKARDNLSLVVDLTSLVSFHLQCNLVKKETRSIELLSVVTMNNLCSCRKFTRYYYCLMNRSFLVPIC